MVPGMPTQLPGTAPDPTPYVSLEFGESVLGMSPTEPRYRDSLGAVTLRIRTGRGYLQDYMTVSQLVSLHVQLGELVRHFEDQAAGA
jgi:hypothetical protein